MMSGPCRRIAARPPDCLDDLIVKLLQRPVKDRLVVHHTISEPAKGIKPSMHDGARSAATCAKRAVDRMPPHIRVVISSQ
jgi:hypothetical protein